MGLKDPESLRNHVQSFSEQPTGAGSELAAEPFKSWTLEDKYLHAMGKYRRAGVSEICWIMKIQHFSSGISQLLYQKE